MLKTVAWGLVGEDGELYAGRGATITRTGVGRYDILYSTNFEFDGEQIMVTLTPDMGAAHIIHRQGGTDEKTKVVSYDAAGVATDVSFYFKIEALKIL